MTDLFAWADEREQARLQRAASVVVSFEAELLKRRPLQRRFDSYEQHEIRKLARAAGVMPPAPILSIRRQA